MRRRIVVGVCHLPALPGSPGHRLSTDEIVRAAERDARALRGVDAVLVENFGDVPFGAGPAEPQVVAFLTRAAMAVRAASGAPVGVNVLRNDAVSALAVACAAGAEFVRVNVLAGVVAAGEGLLQGDAAAVLRYRRRIGAGAVRIFADVLVKHAVPLGAADPVRIARETAYRAGADALVVTGSATGAEPDRALLQAVRDAVPDRPLYVGSGVTPANAADLLRFAEGAIVGTSLKVGGEVSNPVDPKRVRALLKAVRGR